MRAYETEGAREILRHSYAVQKLMMQMAIRLMLAAFVHDRDKLFRQVREQWDRFWPRKKLAYGTPEYYAHLVEMAPVLEAHYRSSQHHPESHPDGVNGMDLLLMLEMLADWADTCRVHGDGDVGRSIRVSARRFGLAPQLEDIMLNTARTLELL